jgi:hypothetical protein
VEFRERERFVLFAGVAAVSFLMVELLAALAGSPLGSGASKLVSTLVLLYLCARLWGHGRTLAERGRHDLLARIATLGAPAILFLLLVQTWSGSIGIRLGFSGFTPHFHVSPFARLEWSADVAIFVLFLATAIAVWVADTGGASWLLSRAALAVLAALGVDLLAAVWGIVSIVPQIKLVLALVVLAVGGTVLVGTVRRVERLDEPA